MRDYEVSKSISILQRLILYYKRKVIIASSQLAIKVNGDNCIKKFTKTFIISIIFSRDSDLTSTNVSLSVCDQYVEN